MYNIIFRPIYVNVDSPYLGFPYFNFLGGYQLKKTPCICICILVCHCWAGHPCLPIGRAGTSLACDWPPFHILSLSLEGGGLLQLSIGRPVYLWERSPRPLSFESASDRKKGVDLGSFLTFWFNPSFFERFFFSHKSWGHFWYFSENQDVIMQEVKHKTQNLRFSTKLFVAGTSDI